MVSTEVQRTLVKSPPELWTELSDPAALARHLEGLGEVKITALEPETRIAWRAESANGAVLLKPSGWGTKVTLTVVREVPVEEAADAPGAEEHGGTPDEEPAHEPQPLAQTVAEEPAQAEPEEPSAAAEEAPPPPLTAAARFAPHHPTPLLRDAIAADDHAHGDETPEDVEPEPDAVQEEEPEDLEPLAFGTPRRERRGFFARLFARRRARAEEIEGSPFPTPRLEPLITAETVASESSEELDPAAEAVLLQAGPEPTDDSVRRLEAALDSLRPPVHATPEPLAAPAPPAEAEPEAQADAAAEQTTAIQDVPDLAAELRAAEEAVAAESEAVLTNMLDRLGAAHHRPFSRA